MITAFLIAVAVALCLNRRKRLGERVDILSRGMGEADIMVMCLIFVLAGAFATVARDAGAVDAAVRLSQCCIPPRFTVAGLFLISALISLAVGTSCGTIAAVVPIALAFAHAQSLPAALPVGAVVSGSMFGDNLSMISDTTIAATRTQGVEMRDKFIANAWIAIPAAAVAFALYAAIGAGAAAPGTVVPPTWGDAVLAAPYVIVLALALCGVNVVVTLFTGLVMAAAVGTAYGSLTLSGACAATGKGAMGMGETLIVALLAGGFFALVRTAGGIDALTSAFSRVVRGSRTCQAGAFALAALINLLTANNTVAIVVVGPVVRDMGRRFGANPIRLAGTIDIASCVVQGLLPYGAQLLIASACARETGQSFGTFEILSSLYYAPILALVTMVSFFVGIKCEGEKRQVKQPAQT